MEILLESGYSKPITTITVSSKQELISTLIFHYTLYRNKAVLDQMKSGLNVLGVAQAMSKYQDILQPFFVCGKQAPLTAGLCE